MRYFAPLRGHEVRLLHPLLVFVEFTFVGLMLFYHNHIPQGNYGLVKDSKNIKGALLEIKKKSD